MLYFTFVSRLVTCLRLFAVAVVSVQPAVFIAAATSSLPPALPPPVVSAIKAITATRPTMPDAANAMSILIRRWSSGDRPAEARRCGA